MTTNTDNDNSPYTDTQFILALRHYLVTQIPSHSLTATELTPFYLMDNQAKAYKDKKRKNFRLSSILQKYPEYGVEFLGNDESDYLHNVIQLSPSTTLPCCAWYLRDACPDASKCLLYHNETAYFIQKQGISVCKNWTSTILSHVITTPLTKTTTPLTTTTTTTNLNQQFLTWLDEEHAKAKQLLHTTSSTWGLSYEKIIPFYLTWIQAYVKELGGICHIPTQLKREFFTIFPPAKTIHDSFGHIPLYKMILDFKPAHLQISQDGLMLFYC
jgi:hypothetical protein